MIFSYYQNFKFWILVVTYIKAYEFHSWITVWNIQFPTSLLFLSYDSNSQQSALINYSLKHFLANKNPLYRTHYQAKKVMKNSIQQELFRIRAYRNSIEHITGNIEATVNIYWNRGTEAYKIEIRLLLISSIGKTESEIQEYRTYEITTSNKTCEIGSIFNGLSSN